MERVIVDCTHITKPGQLGVAIGRATEAKGLQVVNFNMASATRKHPPSVAAFYRYFRDIL